MNIVGKYLVSNAGATHVASGKFRFARDKTLNDISEEKFLSEVVNVTTSKKTNSFADDDLISDSSFERKHEEEKNEIYHWKYISWL